MHLKNYFYFTRSERRAILILLVLIIAVGGACLITNPKDALEAIPDEKLTEDFEKFKAALAEQKTASPRKLYEGETIEINSADTSVLKTIPGIGSSYAARIIKYREALGGFVSKRQLYEVWGINDERYNMIEPYITIQGKPRTLAVNKLSIEQLNAHPYITYRQAKTIIDIRSRKGFIKSMNKLALLDEFTPKDIKRLTPYLNFNESE